MRNKQTCDQDAQLHPLRAPKYELANQNRQLDSSKYFSAATSFRHVLTNRLGVVQSGVDRVANGNGKGIESEERPILALAHSAEELFAGRQDGTISVHSLKSFQCNHLMKGARGLHQSRLHSTRLLSTLGVGLIFLRPEHEGSILAMIVWQDYLISACNRCK